MSVMGAYIGTGVVLVVAVVVALLIVNGRRVWTVPRRPAVSSASDESHEGYVEAAGPAYRWHCLSCESYGWRDTEQAGWDALALHRRRRLARTS